MYIWVFKYFKYYDNKENIENQSYCQNIDNKKLKMIFIKNYYKNKNFNKINLNDFIINNFLSIYAFNKFLPKALIVKKKLIIF